MSIRKLILAVVVAVAVTLGLLLLGSILSAHSTNDPTGLLPTIGSWLKSYGSLIGLLAGLWYYFAGPAPTA